MSIASMTGFARQTDEFENFSWSFELKSVNGKGLEVKTKLPSWLESISQPMKNVAGKCFSRGNIGVYLDIKSVCEEQKVKINEELLSALLKKAVEIYDTNTDKINKPSAAEILALRGVVEVEENSLSEEKLEELGKVLVASFEKACENLKKDRAGEGLKIKEALTDILKDIEDAVAKVESISAGVAGKLKERLVLQIAQLKETVSEERLAQELVLLVTKADIKEEIDRLKAHIKTAKELLASKEPIGRRMDFLCQELNREANTTCSKSCDIDLTNLGMNLKTLIEQFREQIQNIE